MELLCSEISEIEDGSPSRIDGEFIRYDGVAVNWREFMFGPTEILVKSMNGVGLLDRKHFLVGDFLQ
jgi:phosphoribosyl-dephospho-CoA transferase